MIHIILGTKGQLIKMAPIMKELNDRSIEYNLISISQHGKILNEILNLFKLKEPNIVLCQREEDIAKVTEIFIWTIKNLTKGLIKNRKIFKEKGGICLIQGDAPPALLGMILAKINKSKIAHIEAGERTYHKLNPFPEEIIRVIVDKFSDIMFPSSKTSYKNLLKEENKGKIFKIKYNTVLDSVRIALKNKTKINYSNYVLTSIHRLETLLSKKFLKTVLRTIEKVSKTSVVVFPLHESTKNKIKLYNLEKILLNNKNIKFLPLQNYFNFINLINNSKYIVTDGGGPQQESYFLGKPCLLLRKKAEILYFPNVFLSEFKKEKIDYFINNYTDFKINNPIIYNNYFPSKEIIDILVKYIH